jgi:preprotein translocase subunit YajC
MNLFDVTHSILAMAQPPAADGTQQGPPAWSFLITMGLMFVIFYFVLIRPQSKARKEQEELINSAKTGDNVVTTGGILGTIANIKDKSIVIKVADNVKIEVLKSHVTAVTKSSETKAA